MKYYVALGSNIGNREDYLRTALKELEKIGDVKKVSSIYESEPFGFKNQSNFLNAVSIFEFNGEAIQLLKRLKSIEKDLGRKTEVHWGPRIIDLDIIDWEGDAIETDNLRIPHPQMGKRLFVLVPLAEIEPGYTDRNGQNVKDMINSCPYAYIYCYSEQW
ncbi:MAG: 2-amino-4-hydroxy-6-hydroxymethyldihydropteridine diphosphokinase [Calditrichaceae bacterium]